MTAAVTVAIRERLERVQWQRNVPEIRAQAQDIIRKSGGAGVYEDHVELLYDE